MADFRYQSVAALAFLAGLGAFGCASSSSNDGLSSLSGAASNPLGLASVIPRSAQGALVFASQGSLMRVDRNGRNLQALTSGFVDSEPFFHPRGLSIVFSRRLAAGGKQHIYSIRPDGSNPIDLTPDLSSDAFSPYFAWDGSFIVFSVQVGDNDQDLFMMSPDGSGRQRLTQGADNDGHPAVSSDSKSVVFERDTGGGHSKICKLTLDSGLIQDLTSGNSSDRTPTYLPPGNTVVFTRDGAVLRMADTRVPGQLDSLSPPSNDASYPRHSLEQDTIFFVGGGDLFQMSPEGTDRTELTQGLSAEGLAVGPATSTGPAPNQVTVEIVNDSGLADSDVFIMLDTPETSNQQVSAPPTLITNSGAAGVNGSGVALSSLTRTGQSQQSTYTGNLLPIYAFNVTNLKSGRLSISYNTPGSKGPVSILNGASATANAPYRYDKMEITYLSDTGSGGGNLTAIDFFGIPLQVDVTHWGQTQIDALQTKTFYASTPTLLRTINGLSPNMNPAFLNTSGTQFNLNGNLDTFARVLSPNTLAAEPGSGGSAAPYPSFQAYLTSLVGQTFTLNGSQSGGYNYTATVASDGAGGFVINCSGTLNVAAPSPLPNNANVTVLLPAGSMDFFIYACVANMNSYQVAGFPFNTNDDVKTANASAYGAIVGDLQAALNFGYCGGRFGSAIDDFYASVVLPYAYPFGGARNSNDGFYNAYAGLFYYLSDAYGHPYSDRLSAASPLYSLTAGDSVQITLLNDNRLDTPLVSVGATSDTNLNLSWPAVTGATGYKVNVSPAPPTLPPPVVVGGNPQTYALTGLEPGTPYLISVTSVAGNVQSATLPVQGVTTGNRAPLAQVGGTTFQANLNLPASLSNFLVSINGSPVNPTTNASISGALGNNVFGVQIKNAGGSIVYQGNYLATTVAASASTFTLGPATLQYNLTPLTQAGPPGTPPYPNDAFQLVLGTPFNPKPFYQFFPVVFP
ncbi:PD40 domain-containing protein [bacterium]|nr:PD40 domain-containing protein [bacterium]